MAEASHLQVVPDPGPPPHEAPPISTLWVRGETAWRPEARIVSVTAGGRAWVDAERRLVLDGAAVDTDVLPGLSVGADGSVAYARSLQPPDSDVWRLRPGGTPERVTSDGHSDRPVFLPDGRLLWVSSGGSGRAGWILEGRRLTNAPGAPFVPVPAHFDATRFVDGRVLYDAGDGEWWGLDPATGEAGRTTGPGEAP